MSIKIELATDQVEILMAALRAYQQITLPMTHQGPYGEDEVVALWECFEGVLANPGPAALLHSFCDTYASDAT